MNAIILAAAIVAIFIAIAFIYFAYFVQQSAKPYEEPSVVCFIEASRGNYTWQNYSISGSEAVVGPCISNGTYVIYLTPTSPFKVAPSPP